jgi:DNA polymerase III delta' subunit
MSLLLHAITARALEAIQGHTSGSVVFYGPAGLGKATAAQALARRLNCLGDGAGLCAHCRQIEAGSFPDLITITRGDKQSIGIEQVRTVINELALRPFEAKTTRVVLVDEAHTLTAEAQNALLKLLEEPPARTLIILVAERLEALLLTVRSRCRPVRFVRPAEADVVALVEAQTGAKPVEAARLAALSGGVPGLAIRLARDPAAADALDALGREVTSDHSLFDRLLLAGRMSQDRAGLERLGTAMHRQAVQSAAETPPAARLAALEVFRRHLAAGVAPRVAFERLMMEMSA